MAEVNDPDFNVTYNEKSLWEKIKSQAVKAGRKLIELVLVLFYCLGDEDTLKCSEIPSCVLLSLYFNKLIFIHLTILSLDNSAPNTAQWLARRRSTPSLSD